MSTKSATLGSGLDQSDQAKLDSITVANIPSSGEKAALVGTTGTPGLVNQYVTTSDSRMSDSRDPTAHATDHISTGTDVIPVAVPSGASGLLSGTWAALLNAATNLATALTLVLRDAAGRFKAASPDASDDVAIKSYVDGAVGAFGPFHFGCTGLNTGAAPTAARFLDTGAGHAAAPQSLNVDARGYYITRALTVTRIVLKAKPGTTFNGGTYRLEVYKSTDNGGTWGATGAYLDVACTATVGTANVSASFADGDLMALKENVQSNTASTAMTSPTVSVYCTLA